MHNPIQILKTEFKLPIDVATSKGHMTSWLECTQRAHDMSLTDQDYFAAVTKLTGVDLDTVTKLMQTEHPGAKVRGAKYLFDKLVEVYTRAYVESEVLPDHHQVLTNAAVQVIQYLTNPNYQYHWATGEDENVPPKLDANGNVQPAKGDKKVLAKKLWNENQGKITTRKGWIELLCKEVGMTPAGASTYYHNLKTGLY